MNSETSSGKSFLTTRVDKFTNWARKNSLWPMPFGTACCAIELMATLASRFDLSRFGAEAIRFTPRQCDLMIVAGRVAIKELPILKRIWDQMPEPKWCISMGACCSSGGIFDTYTLVQGIDRFIPVDVYIPGCPPRPEAVIDAVIKIQKLVDEDSWGNYKQELLEKHRKEKLYKGPNFPWETK